MKEENEINFLWKRVLIRYLIFIVGGIDGDKLRVLKWKEFIR